VSDATRFCKGMLVGQTGQHHQGVQRPAQHRQEVLRRPPARRRQGGAPASGQAAVSARHGQPRGL